MTRATRTGTALAVALASVLCAAGCAAGDTGRSGQSGQSGQSGHSGPPVGPGHDVARSLPWSLVSSADRTVVIRYGFGGCDRDPRVTRRESATTVSITVTVRHRTGPGVVCPLNLRLATGTVRLDSPLGRRRLVDGGTGDPPPTAPPLPLPTTPPPSPPVPVPSQPTADHTR